MQVLCCFSVVYHGIPVKPQHENYGDTSAKVMKDAPAS